MVYGTFTGMTIFPIGGERSADETLLEEPIIRFLFGSNEL